MSVIRCCTTFSPQLEASKPETCYGRDNLPNTRSEAMNYRNIPHTETRCTLLCCFRAKNGPARKTWGQCSNWKASISHCCYSGHGPSHRKPEKQSSERDVKGYRACWNPTGQREDKEWQCTELLWCTQKTKGTETELDRKHKTLHKTTALLLK